MSAIATQVQQSSASVRIIHSTGLHARPSILFTQLAKSFDATLEIADKPLGPWVDAKSIVKVMGLKAPFGTLLFIRAIGHDAETAVKHLSRLIELDFEEAIRPSSVDYVKAG